MIDEQYETELAKARAEYKDLMERGEEAMGADDEFDEFMREFYTPEEMAEFEFKAKFLDTVLNAYNENMGISRERFVEITVDFLERLKIKDEALQRKREERELVTA
ncbi:MAG: hypothetical protein J6O04_08275 [Selenomonadaceae bacterium]|nr:hypothetical protein [Selenomonadaceae bacterium]